MRNRRGEIATILMLGTLVVIGVTAVISSFTVKDKKTTSSRASCVSTQQTCIGETNTICCDKATKVCGWDSNDKRICVAKPVVNSPTPTTPCNPNKCNIGTGEEYWVRSGKNYSDDKCNEVIAKPITDWCKGSGLIPIPSKTPVPSTTNTKTYCSGTTGIYYYKCTSGNYVDSTCNKEKIPDVIKWCTPTISTSPIPTNPPASGKICPNGSTQHDTTNACVDYCASVSSKYIYNSQWTDTAGHHCCCATVATVPTGTNGKPNDSCCLFKCKGGVLSDPVVYAPSLSAASMPLTSCNGNPAYGGKLYLCGYSGNYSCIGDTEVGEIPPTPVPAEVVIPPATDDCEKKFANCLEAYKPTYQGTNKFSYYKSKSGTGANIYSSGDANNCTQSTWNEIANHYCKGTPLTEETIVPGEDPKGGTTPGMTVEPTLDPTMVALSCSTDICSGTQTGNSNTVYHNTTTDRYYKSNKKSELFSYGVKASYCECGNPKPTEAPNTTDYSKKGSIYMYYNCIQDHNTEAPYIACWSGACDKYTNNSKCYIKGTDLYCCGSRRTE